MYLLDTNICVYLMRGTYPLLTEKVFSQNPTMMSISSVSVFELEYGAAKSRWGERTRNKMKMFLAPFIILPYDSADAVIAGRIRGYLEQAGTPIGPYDLQIAAQGLSRHLTIITHNTEEFLRVPYLVLEDWVS